ncbi:MAG: NAD(P)/FAD-dependent oxidoreductase [Kofleriaceae bacterium]
MTGSYWQREADWRDRWVGVPIPKTVDFAVVGGGFAGLATAIELRTMHPAAVIVVFEAERVGFGASGRNAGFLSPLAAPVWLLGAERSTEQAWGAAKINAEVHAVARWIGEHVPDCELQEGTLALQAQSRASESALREFVRAVAHVGLTHRVGKSRVWPGCSVLEMAAYTMHPYKLVRGLADHAARIGVELRERTCVREVQGLRAGGALVHVDETTIEATKVVLCTNAYTASIELGERVGALVVHSFMATARKPDTLVLDGDFTVEVNVAQAYHRTHGDRIVYGGIDKLRTPDGDDFGVPPRERQRLAEHMAKSFGGALAIDEAWSGCFHATRTGLPIIRTSDENHALVFNVGYGGTGGALSLACARLAACVASNGTWSNEDHPRLLALIHSTRISVRDSLRAIARIARGVAMPWIRGGG